MSLLRCGSTRIFAAGDGICVQFARDVFELDIDGLAYVKGDDDELRVEAGAAVPVPPSLLVEVIDATRKCPR